MLYLTQVKVYLRLTAITGAAWKYKNRRGYMQICEDIFTPDVERGQMEEKNVSWLIWKEHAILWENIWGLYCFAK